MSETPTEDPGSGVGADEGVGEQAETENRRQRWTAAMNAANRRQDLIGLLRRARHRLPGDPSFGDPLSVAGPGGASAVARAAERVVGSAPTATREFGLGALQVWQATLERTGRGRGEAEVTVMFTDLVAFSGWALSAGDEVTLRLLREVASAIEPPVTRHRGTVVKRMGDGIMAVFATPDDAVRAAVAAKKALRAVEVDGYRPRMRIGLHTGRPRPIGGDWLGVDVNIAARVMAAGGKGRTMLSDTTLLALSPNTLTELGRTTELYRRGLFTSAPNGVPEDLRIHRLISIRSDR